MHIRRATVEDVDLLIRLRVDYLLDENKVHCFDDLGRFTDMLRDYFNKWIPLDGFIALLAEDKGSTLSTAFLSIAERPPRSAGTTNLVGTVYNVYTYPQYRRKGIATEVMLALLKYAELQNVSSVDLLATEDGKPLYERIGFSVPAYTAMRITLKP